MTTSDPAELILTYLRARYPVLYVVSSEEARAEAAIVGAGTALGMAPIVWSVTNGFTPADPKDKTDRGRDLKDPVKALERVRDARGRGLFIMRDLHRYLGTAVEEIQVIRMLRDLSRELRNAGTDDARAVVLLCPILRLPPDLEKDVTVVAWPMPTRDDLAEVLGRCLKTLDARAAIDKDKGAKVIVDAKRALDGTSEAALLDAMLGLTTDEASNVISRSLVMRKRLDPRVIAGEKEQIIRKDQVLEWMTPIGGLDLMGDIDRLARWVREEIKAGLSKEAIAYGLPPVKGVLIAGPPGTGKTEIMKAIAWELGIPLLGYDISAAMSKYQGEGQERNRQAWERAQSVAPAGMFMDEVDKQYAGTMGSGDTDGGTKLEMFGEVLKRMSAGTPSGAPLIIMAAANDVRRIPAPFYRDGRLDARFWVDLPQRRGREEILAIHLRKRGRNPEKFGLDDVAKATQGYVGGELEAVVVKAMRRAFTAGGREVETDDLLAVAKDKTPQSKVNAAELDEQRKFAEGKFEPVSSGEDERAAGAGGRVILD